MLPGVRKRLLAGVAIATLLPLATALFVRPQPVPLKISPAPKRIAPVSLQPPGTFSIDAILVNGRSIPIAPRAIHLERGATFEIAGWALDPRTMDQGEALAACIDDGKPHVLTGYGQSRPDVATALGIAEAERSGFRSRIPIAELRSGPHVVQLSVMLGNGRRTIIPTRIAFDIAG